MSNPETFVFYAYAFHSPSVAEHGKALMVGIELRWKTDSVICKTVHVSLCRRHLHLQDVDDADGVTAGTSTPISIPVFIHPLIFPYFEQNSGKEKIVNTHMYHGLLYVQASRKLVRRKMIRNRWYAWLLSNMDCQVTSLHVMEIEFYYIWGRSLFIFFGLRGIIWTF